MKKYYTFTLFVIISFFPSFLFGQNLLKGVWGVHGSISSIVTDKDYIYLGGNFDYIGPATGSAAIVPESTLFPDLNFPVIDGKINTVLPDGTGGWYIAGAFQKVGGEKRNNLAHIYSNGTLSPWNPDVNGEINQIAIDNDSMYIAGYFTKVGKTSLQYLAKIDLSTGKPDVHWNPEPDDVVYAIAVDKNSVYVGGRFRKINGVSRYFTAKLNKKNGKTDTKWNTQPNNVVHTIAIHGDAVYLGGEFTSIWGMGVAYYAAKLNKTDGAPIRPFWYPNPNSYVKKIVVTNDLVFLMGDFTEIGRDTVLHRPFLARVGTGTGKPDLYWNPKPDDNVNDIFIAGKEIYVAGNFRYIGGADRNYLAKLDDYYGLADKNWKLEADGPVYCLKRINNTFFVGGHFSSIGGVTRYGLARLKNSDFTFDLNWLPEIDSSASISCLAQDENNLYVGGNFTYSGKAYVRHLAKIEKSSGKLDTTWKPDPDQPPSTLAIKGNALFVGGNFHYIGSSKQHYLAKLSTTTGYADLSWTPNISNNLPYGDVSMLKVSGPYVYVGGRFYNEDRTNVINYFHRIDISTGKTDPLWNPNPNAPVLDMAMNGVNIFVSGEFNFIGGQSHAGLAKLNYKTGKADNLWQPVLSGGLPLTLAASGDYLYVGGSFSSIDGQKTPCFARISLCSGTLDDSWNPAINNSSIFNPDIEKIAVVNHHLVAGGEFNHVKNTLQNNLAIFDLPTSSDKIKCTSISTGSFSVHTMVIRSSGKIYGWGSNSEGELGNNSTTDSHVPVAVDTTGVLSGKTITKIAVGGSFSMALSSDGKIYTWGDNTRGQLGINSFVASLVPVPVDTTGLLSGITITDIAAGCYYALALSSTGKIFAWGANEYGQLGIVSDVDRKTPVAVDNTGVLSNKRIVSLSAGFMHGLALSSDGKVFAWGDDKFGELGNNVFQNKSFLPVAVDTSGILKGKKIVSVAAGTFFSLALDQDGNVYAWGFNSQGELGNNAYGDECVPVAVYNSRALSGKKIIAIAAGNSHALALASDGTLYGWGDNSHGQLGNNKITMSRIPIAINTSILKNKKIVAISAGADFSIALSCDGEVYTWGGNKYGQLGNNSTTDSYLPVKVNWMVTGTELYSSPETDEILSQNYPNPFWQTTHIRYTVPQGITGTGKEMVTLRVFDLTGHQIATIVHQKQAPGNYVVNFNAAKLNAGYYFYRLQIGNRMEIKKMVLLK